MKLSILALGAAAILLGGCVAPVLVTKVQKFPRMYEEKPVTIFVMPPINSTTAADAKEYYTTAIPQPLAFAGFYVLPVELTGDLLKSQGLYDTELLVNQPLNRFAEYFGADAVLFTHIKKWDKAYAVLAATLTVTIDAKLKSTTSNEVLWEYSGTIVADLSGQTSTGNPLVDLVARAIITGINTAASDYVPYAQLATTQLLQTVPFGKYHARSGQDGQDRLVDQGHKEQPTGAAVSPAASSRSSRTGDGKSVSAAPAHTGD
jgi:hypothetical protein